MAVVWLYYIMIILIKEIQQAATFFECFVEFFFQHMRYFRVFYP